MNNNEPGTDPGTELMRGRPTGGRTAMHWHFYRVRWGKVEQQADGGDVDVDVDLFFARNNYDTVEAAATALITDVVRQYPAARHRPSHAEAHAVLLERPGSTYQYVSPVDGPTLWRLTECSGRCERTMQDLAQLIERELAERIAISLRPPGGDVPQPPKERP